MQAFQRTLRPNQITAVSNGIRKFITTEQQQQLMNNYAKVMLYGNNYSSPSGMAEFAQNCCDRLGLPNPISDLVASISENIYQQYGGELYQIVDYELKQSETGEFLDLYQEQQQKSPKDIQNMLLGSMSALFEEIDIVKQSKPQATASSTCIIEEIDEPKFKWQAFVGSLKKKVFELMRSFQNFIRRKPSNPDTADETEVLTLNYTVLCIGIAVVFSIGSAIAALSPSSL